VKNTKGVKADGVVIRQRGARKQIRVVFSDLAYLVNTVNVPCSYSLTAMSKFDLLRHVSEFRLKSSVVLIIGNSKSNHLGAQGTFNLEHVRIHVIYRVNQAEYAICIPVATLQEDVNTYSPRRGSPLHDIVITNSVRCMAYKRGSGGRVVFMLGGWVNPHREQQTIPQGQTSIPPISPRQRPTAKARHDQAALAASAEARRATHQARPRSPSRLRQSRAKVLH